MLNLEDVVKKYTDQTIIRLKDIKFEEGQSYCILGPSGCGKSTLLNMLAGVISPSEGAIYVRDRELGAFSDKERASYSFNTVGYITQDFRLFDSFSVGSNLRIVEQGGNLPNSPEKVLNMVSLLHKINHKVKNLSGGEKQRVSIARALLKNPDIMLCDEPTASLNTSLALEIIELLVATHKETSNTLIVVTHDDRLVDYFDHVIRFEDIVYREGEEKEVVDNFTGKKRISFAKKQKPTVVQSFEDTYSDTLIEKCISGEVEEKEEAKPFSGVLVQSSTASVLLSTGILANSPITLVEAEDSEVYDTHDDDSRLVDLPDERTMVVEKSEELGIYTNKDVGNKTVLPYDEHKNINEASKKDESLSLNDEFWATKEGEKPPHFEDAQVYKDIVSPPNPWENLRTNSGTHSTGDVHSTGDMSSAVSVSAATSDDNTRHSSSPSDYSSQSSESSFSSSSDNMGGGF